MTSKRPTMVAAETIVLLAMELVGVVVLVLLLAVVVDGEVAANKQKLR